VWFHSNVSWIEEMIVAVSFDRVSRFQDETPAKCVAAS